MVEVSTKGDDHEWESQKSDNRKEVVVPFVQEKK